MSQPDELSLLKGKLKALQKMEAIWNSDTLNFGSAYYPEHADKKIHDGMRDMRAYLERQIAKIILDRYIVENKLQNKDVRGAEDPSDTFKEFD